MIQKRKREDLYQKFRQGAVPSGADFADLIRSQLNLLDDGIDVSEDPEDPIVLRAHGRKENLLDFADQENRRRWRISGRCEDESKEGLNIKADERSRLYIERESGNVGLSTDQPTAKLHIVQTSAVDALRIDDEGNDETPLVVTAEGNVGIGLENPGAKLHLSYSGSGDILRVDDTDQDTTPFVIKDNGDVCIGCASPEEGAMLTVLGAVCIGELPRDENGELETGLVGNSLYVEGNIEVGGSVIFSASSGVGGIKINGPLTSEAEEVIIRDNLKIIADPETGANGNLSVAGNTTLGTYTKIPGNQNVVTINGQIRSGGDSQSGEEQYALRINDIFTVDRTPLAGKITVEGDLLVLGTSVLGNNQADDCIYLNGLVKREGGLDIEIDNDLRVTKTVNLYNVIVKNNLKVETNTNTDLYNVLISNNLTVSKTANLNAAVIDKLTVNESDLYDAEISELTVSGNSNLNNAVATSLKLQNGPAVNGISTDQKLEGNSDSSIPTERAVKAYVDSRVSDFIAVYN